MPPYIGTGIKGQNAVLVDESNQHEYETPRDINRLFADVMQAILQTSAALKRKRLAVSHDMTKEQARARYDVGVFTGRFHGWACTLNWTTRKHDGIPARHIACRFHDINVCLLAPYADMESQWLTKTILPEDLRRDAQAIIAQRTGKDRLFEALGGAESDSTLRQKKGEIAASV